MAAHLGFTVQNKSFWGFCLYVASARAHAEPCWAWSCLAAIQQRMSRLIFSSCQIHFNIANTMLVGISRQIAASPTSPISPQCKFSTINSLVYSVEWRHVFVAKTMSDSNYIVVKDHFFLSYILSRFLFFLSFFFLCCPTRNPADPRHRSKCWWRRPQKWWPSLIGLDKYRSGPHCRTAVKYRNWLLSVRVGKSAKYIGWWPKAKRRSGKISQIHKY